MRRFLFEADDDDAANNNNNQAANTAANDNNTEDSGDDNQNDNDNQDDNQDNNQDDQNNDNQDDNQDEDNQDDENYDIDDNDNGDGGDDNTTDESSDDDSMDDSSDSKADALKAKDRELFNSLSTAEQQIKIKELKIQFSDLYNNCMSISERIDNISLELIDEYPQLKKVNGLLYELKNMISFYILNIYDNRSFFENDIVFNRYLVILNGIKKILETIKNDKKDDK